MSYIIYADIESLLKKVDECADNPENSTTTKVGGHIPCGYSMSIIWIFNNVEHKHTLYCEEDCMKSFAVLKGVCHKYT